MSDKTERLRRLLDERGVEWEALPDQQDGDLTITATRWHDDEGGLLTMFISEPHGSTWDFFWLPTPEQAIAATLGSGTCRDVCNGVSEFTCSVCGFNCDLTSWISLFDGDDGRHRHHHHGIPNYCPNCGRRVEVDE